MNADSPPKVLSPAVPAADQAPPTPPAPRPPSWWSLQLDRGWGAVLAGVVPSSFFALVFGVVVACIQNRGLENLANLQAIREQRLAKIELQSRWRSLCYQVEIAQEAFRRNRSGEFVHGNTDGLRAVVFGYEKAPDRIRDTPTAKGGTLEIESDNPDGPHVVGYGSAPFERHSLSTVAEIATRDDSNRDRVDAAVSIETSVLRLTYNLAGRTWKCSPSRCTIGNDDAIKDCKKVESQDCAEVTKALNKIEAEVNSRAGQLLGDETKACT